MWNNRLVDVLSLAGASPDGLVVRAKEEEEFPVAVVEIKTRVPFRRAKYAAVDGWEYSPTIEPHKAPDVSHLFQIQFQMHATTAPVGYLCSHSIANGTQVFRVGYSPSFMRSVSSFLKILVPQYLTPDAPLPKCNIAYEGTDMARLHRQMLDELADIVVEPMLPHNRALLGAPTYAFYTAMEYFLGRDVHAPCDAPLNTILAANRIGYM